MRKTIAIDMDGVIADVEAQFLSLYEKEYGIAKLRSELRGKTEEDAFEEPGLMRKYARTAGFFRTVPLMPGAVEAVKKLSEHFDIYIVSAAMEFPLSLSEKLAWLGEHFPFISWRNIIFCGDKSIINTDFMIDDHIKNLDFFKGKTIMFDAFHNTAHKHHRRAYNWDEVLKLMEEEIQ